VDEVLRDAQVALTYWTNGILAVLYWLLDHWPAIGGLVLSLVATTFVEAPQARLAGNKPRRYDRGTVQQHRRITTHWPSLSIGILWAVAAGITPAPVPYIGLLMWMGAIVAPLALPVGKRYLAHRLRWFIGVYSALCLGFWLINRFPLSPQQAAAWSERMQAAGAGEALELAIRAQFLPYVALLMWAIFPLAYFGYLTQQLAVQRRFLISPFTSVQDRIAAIRTRGET
jgi:hypothetical protein